METVIGLGTVQSSERDPISSLTLSAHNPYGHGYEPLSVLNIVLHTQRSSTNTLAHTMVSVLLIVNQIELLSTIANHVGGY